MSKSVEILRLSAIVIVLLAGSCAAPSDNADLRFAASALQRPIEVEPQAFSAAFVPPSPAAGLAPADSSRLGALVADYLAKGEGAISVSVPKGDDSPSLIAYFGEKLVSLGVPRARILVRASAADKVVVGYMGYAAVLEQCGDWSSDVASVGDNRPLPNLGCAVKHNIAAQVSDPRDFLTPRPVDRSDPMRRLDVFDKYEQGKPTASEKTEDQSGKVSDVGK